MNKKLIYVALVSSALGTAIGTQFPELDVKAGVVESKKYKFGGSVGPALKNQITSGPDGVVFKAFQHANNSERMDGALTTGECPIRHLFFHCTYSVADGQSYTWEYMTKKTSRTHIWGEPQE
jgi:hypothetical protein